MFMTCIIFWCYLQHAKPPESAQTSSFHDDNDDFPLASESFLAEMLKEKSEEDKENG